MVTIRKLEELGKRTRLHKCSLILHEKARALPVPIDAAELSYLDGLLGLMEASPLLDEGQKNRLILFRHRLPVVDGRELSILLMDAAHLGLQVLGAEPAEWDFMTEEGALDAARRDIRPFTVILDRIRSPYNIGALFRTADSFGVEEMLLIEGCASPLHVRAQRTSRGCTNTVPWRIITEADAVQIIESSDRPAFSLETGGTLLGNFQFPGRGIMVVGNEEFGVSPALQAACDASLGRVTIPQGGTKASLNVSVAFGVVLYAWFAALQ